MALFIGIFSNLGTFYRGYFSNLGTFYMYILVIWAPFVVFFTL